MDLEEVKQILKSCNQLFPSDEFIHHPKIVGNYSISRNDVKERIIDWVIHHLEETKCPYALAVAIAKETAQQIETDISISLENADLGNNKCLNSVQLYMQATKKLPLVCNSFIEKLSEDLCNATRHKTSAVAVKNKRRKMEDRHVIHPNLNALLDLKDMPQLSYYAIFDGHAGIDAASYAAAYLHTNIVRHPAFLTDTCAAIEEAYRETDENLLKWFEQENIKNGCTAVSAIIRDNILYLSWLGDSQAVLIKNGRAHYVTFPHLPDREDEIKRITDLGGTVINVSGTLRVHGVLAVARALGDPDFKPYVSSDPDVVMLELDGTEDFLILACDGLWDGLSPESAVTTLYNSLLDRTPDEPLETIAANLVHKSIQQGSDDNITVVVVILQDLEKISKNAVSYLSRSYAGVNGNEDIFGVDVAQSTPVKPTVLDLNGASTKKMKNASNVISEVGTALSCPYPDGVAENILLDNFSSDDTGIPIPRPRCLGPEATALSELPTPPIDDILAAQNFPNSNKSCDVNPSSLGLLDSLSNPAESLTSISLSESNGSETEEITFLQSPSANLVTPVELQDIKRVVINTIKSAVKQVSSEGSGNVSPLTSQLNPFAEPFVMKSFSPEVEESTSLIGETVATEILKEISLAETVAEKADSTIAPNSNQLDSSLTILNQPVCQKEHPSPQTITTPSVQMENLLEGHPNENMIQANEPVANQDLISDVLQNVSLQSIASSSQLENLSEDYPNNDKVHANVSITHQDLISDVVQEVSLRSISPSLPVENLSEEYPNTDVIQTNKTITQQDSTSDFSVQDATLINIPSSEIGNLSKRCPNEMMDDQSITHQDLISVDVVQDGDSLKNTSSQIGNLSDEYPIADLNEAKKATTDQNLISDVAQDAFSENVCSLSTSISCEGNESLVDDLHGICSTTKAIAIGNSTESASTEAMSINVEVPLQYSAADTEKETGAVVFECSSAKDPNTSHELITTNILPDDHINDSHIETSTVDLQSMPQLILNAAMKQEEKTLMFKDSSVEVPLLSRELITAGILPLDRADNSHAEISTVDLLSMPQLIMNAAIKQEEKTLMFKDSSVEVPLLSRELITAGILPPDRADDSHAETSAVDLQSVSVGIPEAEGVTEDVDSDSEKDGGWSYMKGTTETGAKSKTGTSTLKSEKLAKHNAESKIKKEPLKFDVDSKTKLKTGTLPDRNKNPVVDKKVTDIKPKMPRSAFTLSKPTDKVDKAAPRVQKVSSTTIKSSVTKSSVDTRAATNRVRSSLTAVTSTVSRSHTATRTGTLMTAKPKPTSTTFSNQPSRPLTSTPLPKAKPPASNLKPIVQPVRSTTLNKMPSSTSSSVKAAIGKAPTTLKPSTLESKVKPSATIKRLPPSTLKKTEVKDQKTALKTDVKETKNIVNKQLSTRRNPTIPPTVKALPSTITSTLAKNSISNKSVASKTSCKTVKTEICKKEATKSTMVRVQTKTNLPARGTKMSNKEKILDQKAVKEPQAFGIQTPSDENPLSEKEKFILEVNIKETSKKEQGDSEVDCDPKLVSPLENGNTSESVTPFDDEAAPFAAEVIPTETPL